VGVDEEEEARIDHFSSRGDPAAALSHAQAQCSDEFDTHADDMMTLAEMLDELNRTRAALASAESQREELQTFVTGTREELAQARISASICRSETMRTDFAKRERDSALGKLNKTRFE
jgi:dsDNA-binding SOS-regulon protein